MRGEVGLEVFQTYVAQALEEMPEDLAHRMSNVTVVVEDSPDAELAEELGSDVGGLLGLYQGVPLTSRDTNYYWVLPDRITLYKDNIVRLAKDEDDVRAIVKKTVIHEIAHHFGIDDDRLEELGWA